MMARNSVADSGASFQVIKRALFVDHEAFCASQKRAFMRATPNGESNRQI